MKKILLYMTLLFVSVQVSGQALTVLEAGGWLESAFVKWEPVSNATSYNVYYTGGGFTEKKIDTELIRSYGTYFRADVPGLAPGNYTLTIKPVISGSESSGETTSSLQVKAHDRSGFAFNSGRVPGAYKADGTPKADAQIIYVTQNTKNTVSLNVVGATTNPCVGLQTILDGFKKGKDARPLIIRFIGQVTDLTYMLAGDIVIENKKGANYITLEGIGEDAVADGWGIRIKNAANIEIRNIATMNCNSGEGDNIGLQQDNEYVWVHNCDFFYGDAGSDGDQAKGDGALDSKKSNWVTFSYNHFWDSGKSNLLGLSEGPNPGYLTYHHNWYDHSDSRHPRVRYYSAHIYNNYYDGNSKYGAGSTLGSSLFMEANYFRNCKYPMLTSMQGSDVYNPSTKANDYANYPTFSKENGGTIKAFNNYMMGQARFVPYGDAAYTSGGIDATKDFDAYVVTSKSTVVPATVVSRYGGNIYNNFDTSAVMYAYTVDTPEDAKAKVMQYAGRMNGGDFKWIFNNAVDDTSYAINAPLKAKLSAYKTEMLYVQGEPEPSTQILVVASANSTQEIEEGKPIVNIVLKWDGDATDVIVNGLPAAGLTYAKDENAKTITISGIPTAAVTYEVATLGSKSFPVSVSGAVTTYEKGTVPVTSEEEIHNFTASGLDSNFYSFVGSINSSKTLLVNYEDLTLTKGFKMESSTKINYTSAATSTLILVFSSDFAKKVKVDGVSYTAVNGIVTIPLLPAGSHEILKGDTADLFYIKTVYTPTLGVNDLVKSNLALYPNPVFDVLNVSVGDAQIQQIDIYNMAGNLVKTQRNNQNTIAMSDLRTGAYLVKIVSSEGTVSKIIIKK